MELFPLVTPSHQAKSLAQLLTRFDPQHEPWDVSDIPRLTHALSAHSRVWVIPKPTQLARRFYRSSKNDWPPENKALEGFIGALCSSGLLLENNLPDPAFHMDLGPRFYQLTSETFAAYTLLEDRTPGPFLVLPVDLGLENVGESPATSQSRLTMTGRFGLDPLAILAALFTHQQVLRKRVLWFDAVGAKISVKGNHQFDDTPYIDRRHDNDGNVLHNVDWNYGQRKRSFRLAPSALKPT